MRAAEYFRVETMGWRVTAIQAFLDKRTRSGIGLRFTLLFTACSVGALLITGSIDDGGERGWLTGPLLDSLDISPLLFFVAALVVWFKHRIAAAFALVAAVTSWPWFLYAIYPNIYKPVYLVYKSLGAHVDWSKSYIPNRISTNPWLWLTVLYLVAVCVLSGYLLRQRKSSG